MRVSYICLLADLINLMITLKVSQQTLHSSVCEDDNAFSYLLNMCTIQVIAASSGNSSFRPHRISVTFVSLLFIALRFLGVLRVCLPTTTVAHGIFSFIFIMVTWTTCTRPEYPIIQFDSHPDSKEKVQFHL